VENEVPLGPGMSIEWGGEFENKERAMARLALVVPVALLITLGMLFKAFDSLPLALLTLLNVPFALMGGVFGLWLTGFPLSVSAAVGFIALIGQASLNGVLVMSAIAGRRRAGEPLDGAILDGARERLRPVLMTASLAALGLVPAALSRGIGSETQRPLAVVIVAGTLTACALTLLLLPIMYRIYEQVAERLRARGLLAVPRPAESP
jgi:heavy metal efflux system protein